MQKKISDFLVKVLKNGTKKKAKLKILQIPGFEIG